MYKTVVLPPTPFLLNNNNIAAHAALVGDAKLVVDSITPYHTSVEHADNVIFNVMLDAVAPVKQRNDKWSVQDHIASHFEKGNRVRVTIRKVGLASAIEVGTLAGMVADAGAEEIFLDNSEGEHNQ